MSPSISPQLDAADATENADILLVDDDSVIREIMVFALRTLGYCPIVRGSAAEGLEAAAGSPRLRLLIADVIMPETNGVEFAEKVLTIRPNIQVLFCSGYPQATLARRGIQVGGQQFLQKPISLDALSAKLLELLGPAVEKGAP